MFIFARHQTQGEPSEAREIQNLIVDRARVEEILRRAADVHLAVIGDCMLDVYLNGQVARISPEAPVPVVQVENERAAAGGAANVAAGVVALGARCELVGVVGADRAADRLIEALSALGVSGDRLVRTGDRDTTTKTRVMARHQHVVRFDHESEHDVPEEIADRVIQELRGAVEGADGVILEDYDKGTLVPGVIHAAVQAARERGLPSVADPKLRHFFEYDGVHVFKPNAKELAAALGLVSAPRELDGLERARKRVGCAHLLLTLAEEGMLLLGPDGELHHIRAVARDVFDVSGAGDTVTAVVGTCLAAGATEHEAAIIANYAAGVEVGKAGVVPVRADEILEALDDHRHSDG